MGGHLTENDFDSAFAPLFHDAFDLAYRILGDVDDAEEAAVEALTQAQLRWEKVQQLPYRDAWVMRAAANAAVARARRPGAPSNGDDDNAVLRAAVLDALVNLPRRQREVLALRYVAGVGETDVAACLGISVDSVKRHMLHASTRVGDRVGREASQAEASAG